MTAVTLAVMAVVMGVTLAVKVVMVMGVNMVMGMLMGMLMGVGMPIVGMLMGMGMAVLMVMGATKLIVVNMHIHRSFAFFYHYSPIHWRCQSIYFPNPSPSGACVTENFAV